MSKKCGMPWLKLNGKSYNVASKKAEHHGNNKAVMCEAMKERWSHDEDLDRSKTKYNIYYGYDSGLQLLNDINKEIADMSEELRRNGKRGIREDAITSFAGIIKPDKEVMENLTPEQQIKFLDDAFRLIVKKFGTNLKTGKNLIRAGVIHIDEGTPHLHYFGIPYTSDGRLSAKEIFTPKLNRWLNEVFPKLMNQKGWDLEPCRDEESYQPDIAKTLNEQELEVYKQKCVAYKKGKQKKHGKSSADYKIQKEVEKVTEQEKQQIHEREQKCKKKEIAVLQAQNSLLQSEKEVSRREQVIEQKEANLGKLEQLGANYYGKAKSLYNSLEHEDKEFKANKAKLYKQSLERIENLYTELDQSLLSLPHRKKQKERSL